MPLPILAGTVRASVGGPIAGGSRWSNTWHWRRSALTEPTEAEILELHVLLMTFYGAVVLPQCAGGTVLETANYTPLDGSSGAFVEAAGIAGTGGGDPMPAETAEVMTLRTAARGRQNRGRLYLPAMTESVNDSSGHIAAGVIASILGGVVVMRAAAAAVGWEVGVASYGVSRKIDHTVTPKRVVVVTWTPHFTPCTTITMENLFDVMRNRKH